jgi:hypothetical protein
MVMDEGGICSLLLFFAYYLNVKELTYENKIKRTKNPNP